MREIKLTLARQEQIRRATQQLNEAREARRTGSGSATEVLKASRKLKGVLRELVFIHSSLDENRP